MNRAGATAAWLVVVLQVAYAIVMIAGMSAIPAPGDPIPDPYFTMMEALILLVMPAMIGVMAALHLTAPADARVYSLSALVFMAMCATITMAVHFLILTVSRSMPGDVWNSVLGFRWPSFVYALDILAWDVFFALASLCAAACHRGPGVARWVRWLLVLSGVLSLLGLAGVALADMRVRNIGILGYAFVFPVACILMARVFGAPPTEAA